MHQNVSIVILGVVQGLTEFLPISSSGHLAILSELFDIREGSIEITILLHLATLCAVIVYLHKEVLSLFQSPRLFALIVAATVPTGIIGMLLSNTVEQIFQNNLRLVFVFLFASGVIIFFAGRVKKTKNTGFREITFLQAIIVGSVQGIAVFPGISRSGASIAAGIFSGVDSLSAAKFSFLLSIPAITGASLVKFKDIEASAFGVYPAWQLLVGMLLAFLSALFGLWLFVKIIGKRSFGYFAYYLWALAILGLLKSH